MDMKKKYMKPEIEGRMMATSEMICYSVNGGDTGIGGGGGGSNRGGIVRSPARNDRDDEWLDLWDEDVTR